MRSEASLRMDSERASCSARWWSRIASSVEIAVVCDDWVGGKRAERAVVVAGWGGGVDSG